MAKPKVNTMEELSLAIGVSRPTLSRYFQDPASVRVSTVKKIQRGLEDVDYVPNFFATRLNRKSTGLIGVIIPHLNDLFFTSLLEVIQQSARAQGYTVITQSSHGDADLEQHAAGKLMSMNADGVIVAPLGEGSSARAFERLMTSMPLVFVDSHLPDALPGVPFVGTDNTQSISLILDYLCQAGESPLFLGMPKLNSNAMDREAAYLAEMEKRGLRSEIVPGSSQTAGWEFEAYAHDLMDEHFSNGRFRTGTLLCANDRLAIGALRAANRHRLFNRSGGLRIAGHDDHPLSRFMTPSLTTVKQQIDRIGEEAVSILAGLISDGRPSLEAKETRMFETTLRVRESA